MSETDHKALIRTEYKLACSDLARFSASEIAFLHKYGTWLEALAELRITPLSEAQEAFVSVCQGRSAPVTECERLWHKYQVQRILERAHAGDYWERVRIYGVAAQLGRWDALAWLETERSFLESENKMPDTTLRLLPLSVPKLPLYFDVPAASKATSRSDGARDEDWSNSYDDLDSRDWESLLGGPDDSQFEPR